MKVLKKFFLWIITLILCTGCWDQNLLKDVKLILGVGYDLQSNGKITKTVTMPLFVGGPNGTMAKESYVISAVGSTAMDGRMKVNNEITKRFDSSALMVIILGDNYARNGIYPVFDGYYRDPKSSLLAQVAIATGTAQKLLHMQIKEKLLTSYYISELLQSAQSDSIIPYQRKPVISNIYNPGIDLILPLIGTKSNKVQIKGLAMFNKEKYSGRYLTPQESTLYLLMMKQKSKKAVLNLNIQHKKEKKSNNYITLNILDVHRNIDVTSKNNHNLSIEMRINMKVEVIESLGKKLDDSKEIKVLNQKVGYALTKKANIIIKKSQQANSDIFGVGRHVRAFHYRNWKGYKWKELYPKVDMKAIVFVEIEKHGIFN